MSPPLGKMDTFTLLGIRTLKQFGQNSEAIPNPDVNVLADSSLSLTCVLAVFSGESQISVLSP